MKLTSLLCLAVLSSSFCLAQAPQALNYQAVARTSSGQIIPSQNIGVRFSVLEGTATGTLIFQETHNTATNSFGLFTLGIGKGTASTGTFAAIPWDIGNKFLKVEIAPQGGSNYLLQGTTQLLSVPYALYAEKTKLLAGNNTITITGGNTIMGNYVAANNTIAITGNTIGANYQAGTGINIVGNTISAPGNSLWLTDANGIHNQSGNVGIGTNSTSNSLLTLQQVATGGFSAALDLTSSDVYHTIVRFRNTSANQEWQLHVGGSSNNAEIHAGAFGISNNTAVKWLITGDATTNFMSVGSANFNSPTPKSALHVFEGDVNIDRIGSGIIMKSPNGNCWRITIDNAGNLVRTAIACP